MGTELAKVVKNLGEGAMMIYLGCQIGDTIGGYSRDIEQMVRNYLGNCGGQTK